MLNQFDQLSSQLSLTHYLLSRPSSCSSRNSSSTDQSNSSHELILQREYVFELLRGMRVLLDNLEHPLPEQLVDALHTQLQVPLAHDPRVHVAHRRTLPANEFPSLQAEPVNQSVAVDRAMQLYQVGAATIQKEVKRRARDQRVLSLLKSKCRLHFKLLNNTHRIT